MSICCDWPVARRVRGEDALFGVVVGPLPFVPLLIRDAILSSLFNRLNIFLNNSRAMTVTEREPPPKAPRGQLPSVKPGQGICGGGFASGSDVPLRKPSAMRVGTPFSPSPFRGRFFPGFSLGQPVLMWEFQRPHSYTSPIITHSCPHSE
ncbi:hypothetical protein C8R46DRAFT_1079042 [Mycena filopes]|nr:hypothetical protein C8R46DRAFT_1079042 [Mycena filopes]